MRLYKKKKQASLAASLGFRDVDPWVTHEGAVVEALEETCSRITGHLGWAGLSCVVLYRVHRWLQRVSAGATLGVLPSARR